MGFWKNLFSKKEQQQPPEEDWEQIVYTREEMDFRDEEQRSRYITDCLEQISEASREINLLMGEYSLVTSYLTDMEEIEALTESEREEVDILARRLNALEEERVRYRGREDRMSDAEYTAMRRQENEVADGIERIKKEEKYGALVKQDLKRLDRERHAYEFRKEELNTIQMNLRGMALIFLIALAVCLVMLIVLQFGFDMSTEVGYFLSLTAAAVAIAVLCVKYMDAEREKNKVGNAINKLIQLQNKVKIRYVNNVNLLDYLYLKYNTNSGVKLEKLWNRYQVEKEERKQYAEAEAKIDYYGKQLVDRLANYRVSDPNRWVYQTRALLDKREMVEIRHDLIGRRQALRKQLDYNKEVAATAKSEIMDVVKQFPAYAKEILDMVDRYDVEGI